MPLARISLSLSCHSSLLSIVLVGLLDYIQCLYRALVNKFKLVV